MYGNFDQSQTSHLWARWQVCGRISTFEGSYKEYIIYQSGFRPYFEIEITLITLVNLHPCLDTEMHPLVLLELSAAFNTIYHGDLSQLAEFYNGSTPTCTQISNGCASVSASSTLQHTIQHLPETAKSHFMIWVGCQHYSDDTQLYFSYQILGWRMGSWNDPWGDQKVLE